MIYFKGEKLRDFIALDIPGIPVITTDFQFAWLVKPKYCTVSELLVLIIFKLIFQIVGPVLVCGGYVYYVK